MSFRLICSQVGYYLLNLGVYVTILLGFCWSFHDDLLPL